MHRFLLLLLLASCTSDTPQIRAVEKPETAAVNDSNSSRKTSPKPAEPATAPPTKEYSNARFKEVRVTKTGDHKFRIQGKGQIFEASFSWVVEDGHDELKKGFQMTDSGAPEWGNFDFTLEVEKKRPNSTLTLILFESSPKDGSRQYELPLPLY